MRAFHYSLDPILQLRRSAEEQRQAAHAAAVRAETDATRQLAACRERQAQCRLAAAAHPERLTLAYLAQREAHLLCEAERETALAAELQQAREQTERCRLALQQAAQEVRRLEKHRGHRHAAWQAEQRSEENHVNDEIGMVLTHQHQHHQQRPAT